MPCDQWPTGTDPAFTNYMNDLSFRLPDNFPSARSLLLIATSAPLMIINLGSPTAISPFSCHRTTPSTASPAPCSWRRSAGPSSRIPVTAWTGSITIFS